MTPSLHIRVMQRSDVAFADSLRALAGWNQTTQDWERFLSLQPEGNFLAEWDGCPAGTATTTRYGSDLAWIGMVLVHPGFRRRGIGRALLLRCIEHLKTLRIRCVKLDATPEGRLVYQALGFRDEWTLRRWEADGLPEKTSDPRVRPLSKTDINAVSALDCVAFGASRQNIIDALIRQSVSALIFESTPRVVGGYGMLRPGSRAFYMGPIVATSQDAGIALAQSLLSRVGAGRAFWDIPDSNEAAICWARGKGFMIQRNLTRMWLGESCIAGEPAQVFGLAGPEIG